MFLFFLCPVRQREMSGVAAAAASCVRKAEKERRPRHQVLVPSVHASPPSCTHPRRHSPIIIDCTCRARQIIGKRVYFTFQALGERMNEEASREIFVHSPAAPNFPKRPREYLWNVEELVELTSYWRDWQEFAARCLSSWKKRVALRGFGFEQPGEILNI